jgi:hypothetical protein
MNRKGFWRKRSWLIEVLSQDLPGGTEDRYTVICSFYLCAYYSNFRNPCWSNTGINSRLHMLTRPSGKQSWCYQRIGHKLPSVISWYVFVDPLYPTHIDDWEEQGYKSQTVGVWKGALSYYFWSNGRIFIKLDANLIQRFEILRHKGYSIEK